MVIILWSQGEDEADSESEMQWKTSAQGEPEWKGAK